MPFGSLRFSCEHGCLAGGIHSVAREGPIVAAAVNGVVPSSKVLDGTTLSQIYTLFRSHIKSPFFSGADNTTSREYVHDGTRLKVCLFFGCLVSLTGTLVSSFPHPVVDRCTCVRLMTLARVLVVPTSAGFLSARPLGFKRFLPPPREP